ncbi:restriction endonuclease subunit S [Mycoplasmopsis cynos]|uniref:restriction endonuclease subunit S n=1 Tax=Mycoplasmopsis cynos TaxID=171284 RepID=UPI002AFE9A9C|nr:restriction endonuclease subunit S [Mycoplasmopsis cynos]WQQ16093.1 restriction endonuclease subunit S [Mycoplasmopsis cynos]
MKLTEIIQNKSKVNTLGWKPFLINSLFDIKGTKTTKKNDLKKYGNGQFPYVTTKSTDNGIEDYYNYWTEEGNVLVVDSAVAGYMSYQESNFSASDHVEKLVPKFKLNKNIGTFICTVWNATYMGKKYSYILKASQKQIREEVIFLPVDQNQNPDWNFMEEFISNIYIYIYIKKYKQCCQYYQSEENYKYYKLKRI